MDTRGRLFVGDRSNNRIRSSTRTARSSRNGSNAAAGGVFIDKNDNIVADSGPIPSRRTITAGSAAFASAGSRTARTERSSPSFRIETRTRSADNFTGTSAAGVVADAQNNVFGAGLARRLCGTSK
jgi:hypothetical protein